MPPFAKIFTSRRSSTDSINVHDSCSDSLARVSSPAQAHPCPRPSSRPKGWSIFGHKMGKAYSKARQASIKAACSLKKFSSCTSKPATKDDEFLHPEDGLVHRSSSSIYHECQETFTASSGGKVGGRAVQRAQTNKKGASKARKQVHVQVDDGWQGDWEGDGWDCAPGVAEHIITATGLGRFLDNEDDEQGDMVLMVLIQLYFEVSRNGWQQLVIKYLKWLDEMEEMLGL